MFYMFVRHGNTIFFFQKSKNHFTIVGVRLVTGSKAHKRNQKILSSTVENLDTTAKYARNLNTSVVHEVMGHRLTKNGLVLKTTKKEDKFNKILSG